MHPQRARPIFDAIVTIAQHLRPDWATQGLQAAIVACLNRQPTPTLAEIAHAVIACADPQSPHVARTPGLIANNGPHWPAPPLPPERTNDGGRKAVRCPDCHTDHVPLTGNPEIDPPCVPRPAPSGPPVDDLEAVRDQLREASKQHHQREQTGERPPTPATQPVP